MGDRWQFLTRARRVLEDPELDGVLASTDVLDDLLVLSHLERSRSGHSSRCSAIQTTCICSEC